MNNCEATINLDFLCIDTYQRSPTLARVNKMAKEWDFNAAQRIEVSYRDGKYYVLDGWHRVCAAKKAGVPALLCNVHHNLTKEEESDLFIKLNNKTKVSAIDQFKAEKEAKYEVAITISEICEKSGFKISKNSGLNNISAVASLKICHDYGVLQDTLELLNYIWSDDPSRTDSQFLKGFGKFLKEAKKVKNFDTQRLRRVLGERSPIGWKLKVVDHKSHKDQGLAELFAKVYNDRLSEPRKVKI